MRRVVTGTRHGRSRIERDDVVAPVVVTPLPGYAWHRLWGLDHLPPDPPDSRVSAGRTHFPPAGGLRFTVFTVPPAGPGRSGSLSADAERELERSLPGRAGYMESDQRGMHRTPTLDLICILSGQIWLELDDDDVQLRQGDYVIQQGTRHAWRNRSDRPAVMAIVLIGTVSTSTV